MDKKTLTPIIKREIWNDLDAATAEAAVIPSDANKYPYVAFIRSRTYVGQVLKKRYLRSHKSTHLYFLIYFDLISFSN